MIIPLRIGKAFSVLKKYIYVKPEFGVIGIIDTNYQNGPSTGSFDTTPIVEKPDAHSDAFSSVGYDVSKFNIGLETNLVAGVRIKNSIGVYIKGSIPIILDQFFTKYERI